MSSRYGPRDDMPAPIEPLDEPRLGRGQIRVRNAHGLEPKAPAPVLDVLREGSAFHASRS